MLFLYDSFARQLLQLNPMPLVGPDISITDYTVETSHQAQRTNQPHSNIAINQDKNSHVKRSRSSSLYEIVAR